MLLLSGCRVLVIRYTDQKDRPVKSLQRLRIFLFQDLIDRSFRCFVPFQFDHQRRPVGIRQREVNDIRKPISCR